MKTHTPIPAAEWRLSEAAYVVVYRSVISVSTTLSNVLDVLEVDGGAS